MMFDMLEYTDDTIAAYTKVTGCTKFKKARTPFLNESSLPKADEEVLGELKPNASQCLMKALWLARLSRPDVSKAITDLTTKVQSWSKNDDRRLFRIFCYLHTTRDDMLCGHVGDHADKLYLRVYMDADFCGDSGNTRSTSGGFLALAGPNTFFPLALICKRQTSTSRSTTEAEIVSLAASLFSEALPQVELWEKLLGRPFSCVFEQDNQATVLVSKAGYSPKLRYVNRTLQNQRCQH